MEVKEVEVTKTEKIYTLSEKEYNDLLCKERAYGARKTKEYLGFAFQNYRYRLVSLAGITEFMSDLVKFITYQAEGIPNTRGWSFFDWLKNNRD